MKDASKLYVGVVKHDKLRMEEYCWYLVLEYILHLIICKKHFFLEESN